jgi:hypothetical protein
VLLALLKQSGQLENPFVLLVLHLMGLAETALGAFDFFIEHGALLFRALDVGLQLCQLDFSLANHAFCFDNCAVDRVSFMAQIFVAPLVVLHVLL